MDPKMFNELVIKTGMLIEANGETKCYPSNSPVARFRLEQAA